MLLCQGIDSELARSQEEKAMREDAERWLNTATYDNKYVHPLNGASPLHVAAARGYVVVLQYDCLHCLVYVSLEFDLLACSGII